ncbi:MAG: hypothetical protein K8F92_02510 [Hyphomicrobium sp.]|uniref:hypothetical protein n=1 Tax=Hyphomicrobium sp. TaxID=82 RepID=UPI00132B62E1|nr:hypothetical protein [Hyphomicrobium sp.]KAB2942543.1 MAG: hypothetical protein F9K20_06020 [Hyphomicrobium sp.]MBZ0208514.1 hypothetical protein [Hyphomicrobium sp.]
MSPLIRYHPQYFGLFYASGSSSRQPIALAIERSERTATLYEATNALLVVLTGDTHTESVTRLLDDLHFLTPGVSLIAPSVAKLPTPPRSNIFLDRMDVSALSPGLLQAVLDQNDVFALLDLNRNFLWTLSASPTGLFHDPAVGGAGNAVARLACTASYDAAPPPQRVSQPYDPIASRVSELSNQTAPAVDRILIDLASKWEAVLNEPPPQEIAEARVELADNVQRIREITEEGLSQDVLLAALAHGETVSTQYAEQSAQLLVALDDYDPRRGDYRDHGSSLILKCIKAFVGEMAGRIGLSNPRLFPFFENGYAMYLGAFGWLRRDQTAKGRLIPLSISRVHRMRLGAAPVTAHLVSHIKNLEMTEKELMVLIETPDTDFFRNAIKRIDPQWERPDFDSLAMRKSLGVFCRALSVIRSDLLSCAIAGPAYLYALARFMSPGGYDDVSGGSREGWRRGYPPLSERMLLSLSFLKWRGLHPHFTSVYFHDRETIQAPDFFQWVLGNAASPYTAEEHQQALGDLKRSLMHGNPVSSAPSLVLNALWDGVVRKSGYVDEMAAVASISAGLSLGQR